MPVQHVEERSAADKAEEKGDKAEEKRDKAEEKRDKRRI